MKNPAGLQVCVWVVWCLLQSALALDCSEHPGDHSCLITVEKLLDRAIQHAEFLYRASDETRFLLEESINSISDLNLNNGGTLCPPRPMMVSTSKADIQYVSNKWLLHSILIVIQFWLNPMLDLKTTLENNGSTSGVLLHSSNWMYTKLKSLEMGVLVLVRQILGEGVLLLDHGEMAPEATEASDAGHEALRRNYNMLFCFKKDVHKIETILKLLKCRQTEKRDCLFF